MLCEEGQSVIKRDILIVVKGGQKKSHFKAEVSRSIWDSWNQITTLCPEKSGLILRWPGQAGLCWGSQTAFVSVENV